MFWWHYMVYWGCRFIGKRQHLTFRRANTRISFRQHDRKLCLTRTASLTNIWTSREHLFNQNQYTLLCVNGGIISSYRTQASNQGTQIAPVTSRSRIVQVWWQVCSSEHLCKRRLGIPDGSCKCYARNGEGRSNTQNWYSRKSMFKALKYSKEDQGFQ